MKHDIVLVINDVTLAHPDHLLEVGEHEAGEHRHHHLVSPLSNVLG